VFKATWVVRALPRLTRLGIVITMPWSGRRQTSGYGKLLLANANRVNGIFRIIICAGAIAAGV
jgi:hypothetical protein